MITRVISRRAFASCGVSVSLANSVQLLVDLPAYFAMQAGHRLELLAGGVDKPLRRRGMVQQGALGDRAHPLQLVEHGAGHRPVATASVVVDREAMGLVADPLQELVGLRL